jgi:hypothetical protein
VVAVALVLSADDDDNEGLNNVAIRRLKEENAVEGMIEN